MFCKYALKKVAETVILLCCVYVKLLSIILWLSSLKNAIILFFSELSRVHISFHYNNEVSGGLLARFITRLSQLFFL